ncbi:MAG TPA: DUF5996 family protein [Ignavibacteriaceae bacterium]
MNSFIFPLELNVWRETRDTLQKYCRLVGAIRETLSRPKPHSLHTSLLICKNGFTTSSLPKNPSSQDQSFEVIIDLVLKKLRIESNYREPLYVALTGQSLNALCDETCSLLNDIGVQTTLDRPSFIDGVRGRFETKSIEDYWELTTNVSNIFKVIKNELRGKSSSVHLRPDDLSINLTWFDKETKEGKEGKDIFAEQVEFGFSTGDENIPETYFYVCAFPDTEVLRKFYSPHTFVWSKENLMMATLPFSKITSASSSEETILAFFKRILPLFKNSEN